MQLKRCILELEHELDEMNLTGETEMAATKPASAEVEAIRDQFNTSRPTRPQVKLEKNTRMYVRAFIEQQRAMDKLLSKVECGT